MSHNIHEEIRNLSPVSSISLALLFFYFITRYRSSVGFSRNILKVYWSTRARTITKSESSNTGNSEER